jgi:hypothetical protein
MCLLFFPELLQPYRVAPHWFVQLVILFISAICLFKQADLFFNRAMTTPFAVALTEINLKGLKLDEVE